MIMCKTLENFQIWEFILFDRDNSFSGMCEIYFAHLLVYDPSERARNNCRYQTADLKSI